MENIKNFLKTLNFDYFELPPKKFKAMMTAFKFQLAKLPIVLESPMLLVSTKTCAVDKLLLANVIRGNYLILKDEVVRQINTKTISKKDYDNLLNNIKFLKSNGFSLLVFPEKNYSVFGEVSPLSLEITNFFYETEFDVTYLSPINTFFSLPIWAKTPRRCDTKIIKQNTITHSRLEQLYTQEQNELANKCMPSSASTYAERNKILLRSNQIADGIDRVIYACPRCKEMFSIYAEFNCLKCRNCGSAVEFSENGGIEFTRDIYSYDYLDEFLFNTLKSKKFNVGDTLVKYDNAKLFVTDTKKPVWTNCELTIKFGEIDYKIDGKTKKIFISAIEDLELLPNNELKVYLKKETLHFKGENNENFYILIHLRKLLQIG